MGSALVSPQIWAAIPTIPASAPPGRVLDPYRQVLGTPVLRWSLLGYLIFQAGCLGSFSFIGSWLAKDFGTSQVQLGTSITGAVGGALLTVVPGFWGISLLTAATFAVALLILWRAGILTPAG